MTLNACDSKFQTHNCQQTQDVVYNDTISIALSQVGVLAVFMGGVAYIMHNEHVP